MCCRVIKAKVIEVAVIAYKSLWLIKKTLVHQLCSKLTLEKVTYYEHGREPWSSGYEKRLTFQRLWVRFPAQYTGWTFFTFICYKNCKVCLKRPKINEKEAGVGPFLKNTYYEHILNQFVLP